MNLHQIRQEFERHMRTTGETDWEPLRDDWINDAWQQVSDTFVIPALNRTASFSSVADQQRYHMPYDYNGAEHKLYYDSRRLDPVPERILALGYEKVSGNMGAVEYYDISGTQGFEEAYTVAACTITNKSKTVATVNALAVHEGEWVRFDPDSSGATVLDPGDYGYKIESVSAGVSFTLDRPYRGPTCTTIGRVRPAETPAFLVWGIPSSALTFDLTYTARPQRLYNEEDVPEWPQMGKPIALLAVSIGHDHYFHDIMARQWFGRAMARVKNLQARKDLSHAELVSDLTIGGVVSRRTGARGVMTGR